MPDINKVSRSYTYSNTNVSFAMKIGFNGTRVRQRLSGPSMTKVGTQAIPA
jgi:hypothetical protein